MGNGTENTSPPSGDKQSRLDKAQDDLTKGGSGTKDTGNAVQSCSVQEETEIEILLGLGFVVKQYSIRGRRLELHLPPNVRRNVERDPHPFRAARIGRLGWHVHLPMPRAWVTSTSILHRGGRA